MRYLAAGFGLTIAIGLLALGWGTIRQLLVEPEKLPPNPPRFGKPLLVVVAVLEAGFGTALMFAALDWMRP